MKLTKRQSEIADLAITGMSAKEIAAHLNINYHTVEIQLTKIYKEAEIEDGHGSKRIRLMNKILGKR